MKRNDLLRSFKYVLIGTLAFSLITSTSQTGFPSGTQEVHAAAVAETKVFLPTGIGQKGTNTNNSNGTLGGAVVMDKGMYKWTVPTDGTYEFVVKGAQGGDAYFSFGGRAGGFGAILKGKKELKKDTVLTILVGQKGVNSWKTYELGGGGGGGTFIFTDANNPIVVAGGGGGSGRYQSLNHHASLNTYGSNGYGTTAAGYDDYGNVVTGGLGGTAGSAGDLSTFKENPGAGFFSSKGTTSGGYHPLHATYPGYGGFKDASDGSLDGGFGGGGALVNGNSGGGGGYSGGGSGGLYGTGGGGGSFSTLESPEYQSEHLGDGEVQITYFPPPKPMDTRTFLPTGSGQKGTDVDKSVGTLGDVTSMANGMYKWTVPIDGVYELEARGSQGANTFYGTVKGGLGAVMKGSTQLKKGQVLTIMIGQQGVGTNNAGPGGGGTFVAFGPSDALVIAGGGAGAGGSHFENKDASIGTSGKAGTGTNSQLGGVDGLAGNDFYVYGSGAGFLSSGNSQSGNFMYDSRYPGRGGAVNSSTPDGIPGGFGGGGSTTGIIGGGGGGYSGGGSGGHDGTGGGGGSFSKLSHQENQVSNTGEGKVVITYLTSVLPKIDLFANQGDGIIHSTPQRQILSKYSKMKSFFTVSDFATTTYKVEVLNSSGYEPIGTLLAGSFASDVTTPFIGFDLSNSKYLKNGQMTSLEKDDLIRLSFTAHGSHPSVSTTIEVLASIGDESSTTTLLDGYTFK